MFGVEFPEQETTDALFGLSADQHEKRRRDRLPTVSTLVGPVALGQRMWRTWAADQDRPTAAVVGESTAEWLRQWVGTLINARNLYVDAEEYLQRRLRKSIESSPRLHDKTPYELGLVFQQARLDDHGMSPDRLCRWLLLRRTAGEPLSADELIQTQTSWVELASEDVAITFRQLIGLLPLGEAPTLLVMARDAGVRSVRQEAHCDRSEWLQTLAGALAKLVTRVSQLTVGLAVDEGVWNTYITEAHESFAKAAVRENTIPIVGWTSQRMRQAVARRARQDVGALEPVLDELVKLGASAKLVQSLADAAGDSPAVPGREATVAAADDSHAGTQQAATAEQEPWKSAQECFLFQLLEHTSDLAGLFELNVDPGFRFGNRPAEVDLGCLNLKIALEVDGYYHFTDAEHYRRDRRKDVELQKHGFLVLRFLANDVVPQMVTILDAIRAAVRFRNLRTDSIGEKAFLN